MQCRRYQSSVTALRHRLIFVSHREIYALLFDMETRKCGRTRGLPTRSDWVIISSQWTTVTISYIAVLHQEAAPRDRKRFQFRLGCACRVLPSTFLRLSAIVCWLVAKVFSQHDQGRIVTMRQLGTSLCCHGSGKWQLYVVVHVSESRSGLHACKLEKNLVLEL